MNIAIGDIQGCFDYFIKLLDKLNYNPSKDTLWLVGDLVNRGDKSLEVLEFLYDIKDRVKIVLGNHDIALIAAFLGLKKSNPSIEPILSSSKAKLYFNWLRELPFIQMDKNLGYIMAHAGIAPSFSLSDAIYYNNLLQEELQSSNLKEWLKLMFKKDPKKFVKGDKIKEERFALSAFTRMRFCYKDGSLDFEQKGSPKKNENKDLMPWFECPNRKKIELKIIFGHWSTLGYFENSEVVAIDTGCVWKRELSAYILEEKSLVNIKCN